MKIVVFVPKTHVEEVALDVYPLVMNPHETYGGGNNKSV